MKKDKQTQTAINEKSAKAAAERNPAAGTKNDEANEAVTAFRKKTSGGCM